MFGQDLAAHHVAHRFSRARAASRYRQIDDLQRGGSRDPRHARNRRHGERDHDDRDARAERGEQEEREDERGEGQRKVGEAPEGLVDPSAPVGRGGSDCNADELTGDGAQQRNEDRRAPAPEKPAEGIPADEVEAEQMAGRGLCKRRAEDLVGRVGRKERPQQRDAEGDRHHDEPCPGARAQAHAAEPPQERRHAPVRSRRRGVSSTVARSDAKLATM